MTGHEVRVLTTIEELEALAPDWRALGEQRWGPLVSHAWFVAAARAFHERSTLQVITLWHEGVLTAVAPLVRALHRGVASLELIGQTALYEPTSLVAKDGAALAGLCAAIVDQRLPMVLQRLDVADPCLDLLARASASRGRLRILARPGTNFVDAGEYAARAVSAGLRRKRTRLAEQGFRGEIRVPTLAELPGLLTTVFEIESSGWKHQRGSSLLARPDLRRFLTELAENFAGRGALVIALMRGPERSIATQLCIDDGYRFFELKIGYDEQWGKYSPGALLAADTIEFAVNARQRGYEFLGLAEDWQKVWATGTRGYCAVVFYPRTLAGAAVMAVDVAVSVTQRFRAAVSVREPVRLHSVARRP